MGVLKIIQVPAKVLRVKMLGNTILKYTEQIEKNLNVLCHFNIY